MKGTQTSFPASVDLSTLNPSVGFALNGAAISRSGASVSGAGDINGDGIADLIIGAPYAAGASYVVFGKPGIGSLDLSNLNGDNGFVLPGVADSGSGNSVSGAGDINGDGIADLIIGAPSANSNAGASYVVFGRPGIGSSGSLALSSLNGDNGFVLPGVASLPGVTGSGSGNSVSAVGDINGDGMADLIIGARNANASVGGASYGPGASYVVFGRLGIGSSGALALSSLNGDNGFVLNGIAANEMSGFSVSGVGDINGDGVADLIIGAPYANSYAGSSYVVFGNPGIGSSGSIALSSLNGNNGFVLPGVAVNDYSGVSVSGAGDINGDGIADLIIGAYNANSNAGASYVVFGKAGIGSSGSLALSGLNSSNGFVLNGVAGSGSGNSVSGAGDINGDGIADLIIGAPNANSGAGASYVVFGKPGMGSSGNLALSSLSGGNGFVLNGGAGSNSNSGYSISSVGDINGDGVVDLIIGALGIGASYVVFGSPFISLSNNQLTVTKGQTLLLTSNNLNATYVKSSTQNPNIIFTVNTIQHGYFSLINNTFSVITGFLQQQVDSGQVQFSHDDGPFSPSYSVQIGGGLATLVQPASITFIHQGAVLITNQLAVNQGQTATLFSSQLSAGDLDNVKDNPGLIFLVSAVQYGYFQQTGNLGFPITGFIQSQVQAGTIQFVHDGSSSTPSYNISVSDGYIASTSQASTISFNLAPILDNNTLILNQGQTLVLNSSFLSATDPDDPAPGLTFITSNVQHGQFELVSSPGDSITSFTQAQVQNGTVQFVQDGTAYAPSDKVAVSDGAMTIASQASKIFFNAAPVLGNNRLTVNQGQTVILTSNNLSATDPDDSAPGLTFIVGNVAHGRFERISSPGTIITSFTQAEVQGGAIQFVHDGSITTPSYQVAVSDGKMTILPQPSLITFDASPVLTVNSLALSQGQTVLLSPVNLAATDPDNSAAGLTFLVSDVQHGYFESVSDSGVALSSFIQSQVQNGVIQFVSDGGASTPAYDVSVSDGIITTPAQSASIAFNIAPTLVNNDLTVNQGQPVIITSGDLSATDPDNSAPSLIFIVSGVQYGHFESLTNRGVIIPSFTQGEIQNGQIQWIPDGGSNPPVYSVAVSDGKVSSPSQFSNVTFHVAPVLVNNVLNVKQGQTVIVTPAQISATQAGSIVSSLTFNVSNVIGGQFELVGVPGVAITHFTQAQIQSGAVQFVQDGTATVPSYSIAVSDGQITLPSQASAITFDAMPVLDKNSLRITQGQTLILTSDQLSASDRETASSDLVFTASAVTHGHFEDIGAPQVAITTFGQQRITSGALTFVSDGSSDAPAYNISVSDGSLSTPSAAAIVNFSPGTAASITENNTVRNAIIGSVVSGVIGLGFFAFQIWVKRKAHQRFEKAAAEGEGVGKELADFRQNVLHPIAKRILERIQITGFMGSVSDKTMQNALSAITRLIHELEKQGLIMDLQKLKPTQKHHLVDTIARQVQQTLVPDRMCCSPSHFFCPEVTPAQIEEHKIRIAVAIRKALEGEDVFFMSTAEIEELKSDDDSSRIASPSRVEPFGQEIELTSSSPAVSSSLAGGQSSTFVKARQLPSLQSRVEALEKELSQLKSQFTPQAT